MEKELAENLIIHTNELSKYCRICGGRLQKAKSKTTAPTHLCDSTNRDCLWSTFSVDIDTDDPHIHPAQFCNQCWAATQKYNRKWKGVSVLHLSFPVGRTQLSMQG